mmetsp:Transcript_18585/g.39036  ORF Transcript_18585/g.39036 Transcript_18585/m.39036 type:complete len:88 (-) Transcript_18585:64-327(-)
MGVKERERERANEGGTEKEVVLRRHRSGEYSGFVVWTILVGFLIDFRRFLVFLFNCGISRLVSLIFVLFYFVLFSHSLEEHPDRCRA